jgi:DNA repair protein RadA/Sms
LLLGHVTKEGAIAGPKTVEHLVDVVLHLGYTDMPGIRVMSVGKNRFGPAGGVMFWSMQQDGLRPVSSGWKVNGGLTGRSYGVGISGNVIQLVEINALVVRSYGERPKRMVTGYPFDRFMMLLAILEKYLNLKLYDKDVFVEVGRGFVWRDYALDLPVVAALLSAYYGRPLDDKYLVSSQELTLLGTARNPVSYELRRNTVDSIGWRMAAPIASIKEVRGWLREK